MYYMYGKNGELVATVNPNKTVNTRFVYGIHSHVPDYIIKGTTKYQLVKNHLGSPVQVVDSATGTIAQEIVYDEWGRIISDSSPGFQPFGLAGYRYDIDTQLCNFRAREYDASVGRWLAKDPILFTGGDTNLYGYVLIDPIDLVDPSGLAPGDSFGTESAAEFDAINYINRASVSHNREFSGSIYVNASGGYSYTDPKWGTAAEANPLPLHPFATAIVHTHGAYDQGTETKFSLPQILGFRRVAV